MSHYRVVIRCLFPPGFAIENDAIGGFYTTRFVHAKDPSSAGDIAIESLRAETKFLKLRSQLAGDPELEAMEVALTDAGGLPDGALRGFIFFTSEASNGTA